MHWPSISTDAGIVECVVQTAVELNALLSHLLNLISLGHVGLNESRLAASLPDLLHRLLPVRNPAGGYDDPCSLPGICQDGSAADP